jgi:hypothetical protein
VIAGGVSGTMELKRSAELEVGRAAGSVAAVVSTIVVVVAIDAGSILIPQS